MKHFLDNLELLLGKVHPVIRFLLGVIIGISIAIFLVMYIIKP